MECNPRMDAVLKKRFMMRMMRQLPFKYNDRNEIKRAVINDFYLLDLKEWEEKYPQYPIFVVENIEGNNHGGA